MARGYEYFLVYTKLGADRKFRRLTAAEKWCAVFGVWATAAESPVRGYLLIAENEQATESDYAKQADVSLAVAKSTVRKMRKMGMLERDEEMGVEHIHDWHDVQKDPKPSESKEAWRERKRESRERKQSRKGHAGHASDVTPRSQPNVT